MQNKEQLFEQLFGDFKEKMFRLCYSYCNHNAEAEDLVQESFSKVWIHLDGFKGESAYSTWIYRITVNTCLMHIRSGKKFQVVHDEQVPDIPTEKNDAEDKVNGLYKAITQLNEIDRVLISMVLEDLSYKEIAEVMGISENNVGVKVHRIKGQLKIIMTKIIE